MKKKTQHGTAAAVLAIDAQLPSWAPKVTLSWAAWVALVKLAQEECQTRGVGREPC